MSDLILIDGTVHNCIRCPQCGVASPLLTIVYKPSVHYKDHNGNGYYYAPVKCSKCNQQTLLYGYALRSETSADGLIKRMQVLESYPPIKSAADAIPSRAKNFLQQAMESTHAPDGAVMLAASSVDAMLKEVGYKEGTLFSRIQAASANGLLTDQMRDWAHEIRLSANEPRHADDNFGGSTISDAKQVIDFAEALGDYLFVLPARVKKWKSMATSAVCRKSS